MTRVPTSAVNATRATTFSAVPASAKPEDEPSAAGRKTAGRITSATTVNRSSTTSHPTATWPAGVCRWLWSDNTRTSTTVLATPSANPNTSAPAHSQPNARASSVPSSAATPLAVTAPGSAVLPHGQQLVRDETAGRRRT